MVGSVKSRKVVDPKLHDFTASSNQFAAVEKDEILVDLVGSNAWDDHGFSKGLTSEVLPNALSSSIRSVGFKEPLVAYHKENDPFNLSVKGKSATPQDRPAVTRFLNTCDDVEPVKISSHANKQSMNVTGIAKTVTQQLDSPTLLQQSNILTTSELPHRPLLLSNLTLNATKPHHGADILKKTKKLDHVPGTLAKLKETIQKQKENRSPNVSYSPTPRKMFHDDIEVSSTFHLPLETTPIRKIAVGPAAPKYKGFSTANTRLQTPDGKIWKEDELIKQRPTYNLKRKVQKPTSVSKLSAAASRNNSTLNKTQSKRRPVRKLGKIMSNDPIHKKSLITPTSWKEGQKVAQTILKLMTKKTDSCEPKQVESLSSTASSDDGTESSRLVESDNSIQPDQSKITNLGAGIISAQVKTVLDDLNLPSTEETTGVEKLEFKVSCSRSSPRRPTTRKPQTSKKDSPEIPKIRHYDSVQVQQYMAKQRADRKRRQVEMKKIEKEANEKRIRLLNDLDKRQKEARKKTVVEGYSKEKKSLQDTYTKPSVNVMFEPPVRYEKRLAMFMRKLDEITKMTSDEKDISDTTLSTSSETPVSKFLVKLGKCMQDTDNVKTPLPIQQREPPTEPLSEFRPHHSLQPVVDFRSEHSSSKYDRIAALRAKSESLQERIDQESNRLLENSIIPHTLADTNMFSPKSTEQNKQEDVMDVLPLHTKPTSTTPPLSYIDHSQLTQSDQVEDDIEVLQHSDSVLEEAPEATEQVEGQDTDAIGLARNHSHGTPQTDNFSLADMMYRLNKEDYCAKTNVPLWREKLMKSNEEKMGEPSFGVGDCMMNEFESGREVAPWERMNGDKYSVMNVFTRKYLKNMKPAKTDMHRQASPSRDKDPFATEKISSDSVSTTPHHTSPPTHDNVHYVSSAHPSPPRLHPTDELIRWSEALKRKDDDPDESEKSITISDPKIPALQPPQAAAVRFSPAVLEHKFALELNRYETIGEQIHQLDGSERTQGVAMAQQETVSIAQILQSRQMQHEVEMERLALKAKERALEASQKLQAVNMDKTSKEVKQKEEMADEKCKMAAKMQDEAHRALQRQNEVAQASIKALNRLRSPPSYRDTTDYSTYTTTSARYTESLLPQHGTSSDEQSPTPMSEHSTTSIRPPQDESIREEIGGSSSSSIKEEINDDQKTESSIAEQIYSRDDSMKQPKPSRRSDDLAPDTVHFDESMTEDEKIELSKKAVMPSESHRRQKYKKSPRVVTSQQSDVSSDDVSPTHNRSYISGLDDSLLSSASLFGDADATSFNRFMNEHVRHYMLEEEVRARHQAAMLKLREKALKEKTGAELSWLELQKKQIRNKGEDDHMPPLKKKKRAILRRWQVETEEIKRLKAANKAASQNRELMKQQQKDISRMLNSTQQIKERLKVQGSELDVKSLPGELKSSTPVPHHSEDSLMSESDFPSGSDANLNTSTASELLNKLRKSLVGLDGRRLTTREKALLKRKKEAEKLLEWKRKLDEEEKKVYDIEQQALQAWNKKEKSASDKDVLQKSDVTEKSFATSSISEDIHPQLIEGTSSSPQSDLKEDLRVRESSSEDTIGEEYSQSFASTEPSLSRSEPKSKQAAADDKSSTLRAKPDEASVPLLGRKTPLAGSGQRRESLESWSDESFSQTQSETEQSDVECRVHALKEELKRRRLIADRLKKQQKKKQKEHLRAQEASLKSQIEAYDAFIKTTQQELNLELDSPSSGTPSILAHPPAAKPQIRSPRKSDQSRHISRSLRNSVSSLSSPDASPRAGSQKHPLGSAISRQQSDSESSGRSSRSLSFDEEQHSPDDVITPNGTKAFLPSQASVFTDAPQTDRPNKLDISSAKPLRSMIPVSSKLPSTGRSLDKQVSPKVSSASQEKTKSLSPPESELDRDVSIATEEEVSERLSETSTDRSGASIPIFQLDDKVPDMDDDDDKTPIGSALTTPTPSLPQTPTPDHPDNLSGVDVSDGSALPLVEPLRILATSTIYKKETDQSPRQVTTSHDVTSAISDQLFTNLLENSIDSALSVRNSALSKTQQEKPGETLHRRFPGPMLTCDAQNLISLLSGDQMERTADQLSHVVADELVDETISKVLSIRRSRDHPTGNVELASRKTPAVEQEDGSEVEEIVKNAEEVDRLITRPVSPVFGCREEVDEWFDDDLGLAKPSLDRSGELLMREDWTANLSPTPDNLVPNRVESTEVEFVVLHDREQIVEVAERMVEHLHSLHTQGHLYTDNMTSFEQFESEVENGEHQDAVESDEQTVAVERSFRRSIYDLVRELLRDACDAIDDEDSFPWHASKRRRRPSFCRAQPQSKSEMLSIVCEEVARLVGHRDPSAPLEQSRVSLKWGNMRKKDNVDLLLIDELRDEEAEWTDYDVDEAAVKSQLTETVFDLLLNDTISCLNRIDQSRDPS